MSEKKHLPSTEGLVHLAVLYLVWGSTFLVIRLTLNENGFPPFLLATLRVFVSGFILLLMALGFKQSLKISMHQMWQLALTGCLLWIGGHALVIWGEQKMDSSYAALLFGAMPLWVILFESIHARGRNLNFRLVLSALIGFSGIIVLSYPNLKGDWAASLPSLLALVSAPAFWALGSFLQNDDLKKIPALTSAGYQQIFGGLGCALFAVLYGESFPAYSHAAYAGLAYLTILGSVVAFGSYVRALQLLPSSWVMSFAYVNPLVAVLLGSFFLDEKITLSIVIGMVLIIFGVVGLFKNTPTAK